MDPRPRSLQSGRRLIANLDGGSLGRTIGRCAAAVAVAVLFVGATMFMSPSPSEAAANAVLYKIDLVFDDGGTASGSFVYDPDIPCVILSCWNSGAYSQVSITVSPWGQTGTCASQFPAPRTYTEANLSNITKDDWLAFAPNLNFEIEFATPLGVEDSNPPKDDADLLEKALASKPKEVFCFCEWSLLSNSYILTFIR